MGLRLYSTVTILQLGKHILRERQSSKENLKDGGADEPRY